MKPHVREEIRRIVSKSKNKFTSGPNGIPFFLYKNFPKILKWQHANLEQAWKNFIAVLESRLTRYLLTNECIDTVVQKSSVPGIVACLEYGNMIFEAFQKAKTNKKNLDVIWLDLALPTDRYPIR